MFPDESIEAYLYVSAPIKAVTGIMHLNNKTSLEDWKRKYAYDQETLNRINDHLQHHRYTMDIIDFQKNKYEYIEVRHSGVCSATNVLFY